MKLLLLCAAGALAVPRIELDLSGDYYNEQVQGAGVRPTSSSDWGPNGDGGQATSDAYANSFGDDGFDNADPSRAAASKLSLSNGEHWTGAVAPKVFDGDDTANDAVSRGARSLHDETVTNTGNEHSATNPLKNVGGKTSPLRLRKLEYAVTRTHDGGANYEPMRQPNGDLVTSRQDYTQRCNAGKLVTYSDCPFPIAKAYDSLEKDISERIQTRVFRVDLNGLACSQNRHDCGCTNVDDASKPCQVAKVSFKKRSTYLFKYDVSDSAGNHAEQIVFALIIDDMSKPTITLCKEPTPNPNSYCKVAGSNDLAIDAGRELKPEEKDPMGCNTKTLPLLSSAPEWTVNTEEFEQVEAGSSWELCDTYSVEDNVDQHLKQSVLFNLQQKVGGAGTWQTLKTDAPFHQVQHKIGEYLEDMKVNEVSEVRYLITFKVCDNAGVYGQNAMSNCFQKDKAVLFKDTSKPTILLHGELGSDGTWLSNDANETLDIRNGGVAESGVLNYDAPKHECNMWACNANDDKFVECKTNRPGNDCSSKYYNNLKTFDETHGRWTTSAFSARDGGASGLGHSCDWKAFDTWCSNNAGACVGYQDPGHSVVDSLDTWALKTPARITPTTVGQVLSNDTKQSPYSITYSAVDKAGNEAPKKRRWVAVVDRISPEITLHVDSEDGVVKAGAAFTDPGATCWDMCDKNINTAAAATWVVCPGGENVGSRKLLNYSFADSLSTAQMAQEAKLFQDLGDFDGTSPWAMIGNCTDTWDNDNGADKVPQVTGTYIRLYECTDDAGNKNWDTRKWVVVDRSVPQITRLGDDTETYDASKTVEYTDKGATCLDEVDGTLSSAVEVSGQVVNMKKPGSYVIRYDCQDASGNVASAVFRTVVVEDKSCPEVTLLGSEVNYVEAGYLWVDPGATCKDDLDDQCVVEVQGDVVNTGGAFYERKSCADIKANWCHERHVAANAQREFHSSIQASMNDTRKDALNECGAPQDGQYTITRSGKRVKVFCTFAGGNAITVKECKDCSGTVNDCQGFGLEKYVRDEGTLDTAVWTALSASDPTKFSEQSDWIHSNPCDDKCNYLCSTNDATMHFAADNIYPNLHHTDISGAEQGKYIISYHATDQSSNKECETKRRTVIVRDTLPPVISLHLKPRTTGAKDLVGDGARVGDKPLAPNQDLDSLVYMSDHNDHTGNTTFSFTRHEATVNNADAKKFNSAWKKSAADHHGELNQDAIHYTDSTSYTLMAEQNTSSNTWFMLAAASGVAGLALVALSRKRQPVIVEV